MRTKENPTGETVSLETQRLKGKTFSRLRWLFLKKADEEGEGGKINEPAPKNFKSGVIPSLFLTHVELKQTHIDASASCLRFSPPYISAHLEAIYSAFA